MDWASLARALIRAHVVLITGTYADRYSHTPAQTSGFSVSYVQGGHCWWHPEDTEEEEDGRREGCLTWQVVIWEGGLLEKWLTHKQVKPHFSPPTMRLCFILRDHDADVSACWLTIRIVQQHLNCLLECENISRATPKYPSKITDLKKKTKKKLALIAHLFRNAVTFRQCLNATSSLWC